MIMKSRALVITTALAIAVAFAASSMAATIVINNLDGPGEGFNDPTAVAPVGGNPGVTLGQQRLNAFQHAANLWAACLFSNTVIVIDAQMDPLFCTAGAAVLGSAGATTVHRDFAGAPKAATWYCQALANSLAGADLAPGTADVNATFNSDIDNNNNCLNGINWYYGLDASPPGADIDFVTVVLHEIGHGIGFQTFQGSNGAWFAGFQDAYGCLMYHQGNVPPDYPSMAQAQRGACNIGDPNLVFDGGCAIIEALATLSAGLNNGRPRLHGPNPYQGGSSLSHWSPALAPNQLMEPFYAGPDHTVDLDLQLLKDTGWVLDKTVATAFSAFEVASVKGGIEITSAFYSDDTKVRVNVYRGAADNDRPSAQIASLDVVGGAFRHVDTSAEPGKTYSYRIGVRDSDGEFFSPSGRGTVAVPEVILGQNTPNPFNPTTTITYILPATEHVTLNIFNAQGKLVRTLVDGVQSFGSQSAMWDGMDNNGATVGTGVYFYRLQSGKFSQSKKMVLLK
jgi:hypothetical protein